MSAGISKITYASNITLITLSALPCDSNAVASILTAFAEAGINVDMISQTAPQGGQLRLSFTISDDDMGDALMILGKLRREHSSLKPEILSGNGKLAFFGETMINTPGVAARVFSTISKAGIQVQLITTSEIDISLLISNHAFHDALAIAQNAFEVVPEEVI